MSSDPSADVRSRCGRCCMSCLVRPLARSVLLLVVGADFLISRSSSVLGSVNETTRHCFHPQIHPSLVMLAVFPLLDVRRVEECLYHHHHAGRRSSRHRFSICSDRPHSAIRCTDHSESRSCHAPFGVVGLRPQRLRSGVVDDAPKGV